MAYEISTANSIMTETFQFLSTSVCLTSGPLRSEIMNAVVSVAESFIVFVFIDCGVDGTLAF